MNGERIGYILRQLVTRPTSLIGVLILVAFAAVAVLAPVIAPPPDADEPYSIPHKGYRPEPQPPNEEHPFGTTERQYGVFYAA
jgi:peptide/nickel transport system permease protein